MTEEQKIESIRKNGGMHLKNFKPENITYNMCMAAVKRDGEALMYVPKQYRTTEIYSEACKNGAGLFRIPKEYRTRAMCEDAVSYNGFSITEVPQEYICEELCFTAVTETPQAFQCIPEEYITPEFCSKIIQKNGIEAIRSLPDTIRSASFYQQLIDLQPKVLWITPKSFRSAKLCKIAIQKLGYSSLTDAVKDDPAILGLVPSSMYTQEACLLFVQSSFFADKVLNIVRFGQKSSKREKGLIEIDACTFDLTKILRWKNVSEEALRQNGRLIKFVSDEVLSDDLCNLAISENSTAINLVPSRFLSKETYENAFMHSPSFSFSVIPDEYKTTEMCVEAVKAFGENLKYVPNGLKTLTICQMAVLSRGSALKYVPEELVTKEMCYSAIRQFSYNIQYVPKSMINQEICDFAFQQGEDVIAAIPDQYKTEEMCLKAIKNSINFYRYIPFSKFNHEFHEKAVEVDPQIYPFIPDNEKTQEMSMKAVKADWMLLRYVPKELVNKELIMIAAEQNQNILERYSDCFEPVG